LAQYTPQWHVGDWWIVKSWVSNLHGGRRWQHSRYDVLGVENVEGKNCFVLQCGDTASPGIGPRTLYYVRSDSWRIVRQVSYSVLSGKLMGPWQFDCPQGMFGPMPVEPQWPVFPLDTTALRDSAFILRHGARGMFPMRQFSRQDDSAALRRYRAEPDTGGGNPVPVGRGKFYAALTELGAPPEKGGPDVRASYTLQIWSEDYPWRMYWEWGQYVPRGELHTEPDSRAWLVRFGRSGK
jgi:hypothetical protein